MTTRTQPASRLTDAIALLRDQFSTLQQELDGLRAENERLHSELAAIRYERRQLQGVNLRSLRRRVAVYCHPDRGGNNEVMCNLNTLFDALETSRGLRPIACRAA